MAQLRLFRFCVRAFPRQTARRRERSARMDVLNFLVPLTAPKLNYLVANNTKRQEGKKQKRKTKQKKNTTERPTKRRCAKKIVGGGPISTWKPPRLLYWHHQARKSLSLSLAVRKRSFFLNNETFSFFVNAQKIWRKKSIARNVWLIGCWQADDNDPTCRACFTANGFSRWTQRMPMGRGKKRDIF